MWWGLSNTWKVSRITKYKWSEGEGRYSWSVHHNACSGRVTSFTLEIRVKNNWALEFGGGERIRRRKRREPDIRLLTLVWCWSWWLPSERKRKCCMNFYKGSGLCVLVVGICWCDVFNWSLLLSFLAIFCIWVEDRKLKGSEHTRFHFSWLSVSLFFRAKRGS